MSDESISIRVASSFDAAGITSASQAVRDLATSLKSIGTGAPGLDKASASASKLGVEQAKAATASQRLATEEQRTAQAAQRVATEQGKAAINAQRLATEEQRTASAMASAAAASSRAEQSALRLASAHEKAGQAAQKSGSSNAALPRTLDGISGSASQAVGRLSDMAATAGLAGIAVAALGKGVELAQLGAQAQIVETRFTSLAAAAGQSGESILKALRSASGGEINDLNLQLAANKANLLGVATSAEQFSGLMAIARDRAQQLGISTTQAFDDLVTGLGRGSALILDNLGIMVSADQANQAYAASVGKTVTALTEQERKQALINAVLVQGQATMAATGGAVDSNAGRMDALGVSFDNAKTNLGEFFATLSGPFLEIGAAGINGIADAVDSLNQKGAPAAQSLQAAFSDTSSFDAYTAKLAELQAQTGFIDYSPLIQSQYDFAKSLEATGMASGDAVGRAQELQGIQFDLGSATEGLATQNADLAARYAALVPEMAMAAASSEANRTAIYDLVNGVVAGSVSIGELEARTYAMSAATQENIALNLMNADAMAQGAGATAVAAVAAQDSADKSLLDAAAKQQQAAELAVLEAQTKLAADSFLALNPNITGSGVASAVASGKINAAVGQYITMTLATAAARVELARLQNQAGIQAAIGGAGRADRNTRRVETRDRGTDLADRNKGAVQAGRQQVAEAKKAANEQRQAQLVIAQATGNTTTQVALLRQQQQGLTKDSLAYAQIEAQIIGAQKGKGGGAGAGGATPGAARATSAQKAGTKLADIEQSTGQKLADIDQKTQDKLLDIDKKAAEQRIQQQRDLAEAMLTTSADLVASQEANDLDLIGAKEDQIAGLAAREQAEATARISEANAVAEAQKTAAEGQADVAKDVYEVRQNQIASQQRLDEEYAKRQAELASNPEQLAALKTQYDEATTAIQTQAQVRIDLAKAEAEQRAGAAEQEKIDVLTQAEEQKVGVVGKALDQSAGVKAASADQRAVVVGNAQAQAKESIAFAEQARDGVNAAYAGINAAPAPAQGTSAAPSSAPPTASAPPPAQAAPPPAAKAPAGAKGGARGSQGIKGGVVDDAAAGSQVILNQGTTPVLAMPSADGGGGGGGGGSGGPTTSSLKDQIEQTKAEIELLTALMRLKASLAGQSSAPVDAAIVRQLAQDAQTVAQTVAAQLLPSTEQANAGLKFAIERVGSATDALKNILDLKKELQNRARYPIDPTLITYLATDAQRVASIIGSVLAPATEVGAEGMQHTADVVSGAIDALKSILDLKKGLAERAMYPINPTLIKYLAQDAQAVAAITGNALTPQGEAGAQALAQASSGVQESVKALTAILDLKKGLQDRAKYPVDPQLIKYLAADARAVAAIVGSTLTPQSEEGANALARAAAGVGSSVDALGSILDLKKALSEQVAYPIDPVAIGSLAQDAARVTQIVTATLIPQTEDGAKALGLYASAAGDSIGIVSDTVGLKKTLSEGVRYPIDAAAISGLADDAARVTQIVAGAVVPQTEAGTKALSLYAEAVGSSVGIIGDISSLTAKMFTDYYSPSDGDIQRIADDANRIVGQVAKAAATYDTKGLEGAKLFADAAGGTFSAFKDGLLFFDALKSGDFQLDTNALSAFEKSTAETLAVAGRLGAIAVQIPAANLSALQTTTAALSGQAEALIRLAAVPWGDLGAATAGLNASGGVLAGGGGGGGGLTVNVYNPPVGVDVPMLIKQVKQGIMHDAGARR